MDWQEKLQAFKDANPDLPEGEESDCRPLHHDVAASKGQRLDIVMERKGRGGKTATIVCGFKCSDSELREIASRLKNKLGTGGSARGNEILIQGDRRNDVARELTEMGFKARITN